LRIVTKEFRVQTEKLVYAVGFLKTREKKDETKKQTNTGTSYTHDFKNIYKNYSSVRSNEMLSR